VDAHRVSGNYFAVLGSRFVAGRPFTEAEAEAGEAVAVVSESLWRRMLGADRTLATPLRTSQRSYTVVGVVAEGQEFPAGTDLFVPASLAAQIAGPRINVNWTMLGRLAPGATVAQAAAEMTAIARGVLAQDPDALYDHGVMAEPLADALVGDIAGYLRMLMAVVLCVLLIVCANIAASSLARASARGRELAVRASLGAARARLVQQMLIEHAVLGVAGGVAGLCIGWVALRAILLRWVQFPCPPTQYNSLGEGVLICQPKLFPKSKLLTAIKDAPPFPCTFSNFTCSRNTLPDCFTILVEVPLPFT
jgi:putative ABC transport system permease protein